MLPSIPMMSFPHLIEIEMKTAISFDESGAPVYQESAEPLPPFKAPAFVDTSPGMREYNLAGSGKAAHTYSVQIFTPYDERITGNSIVTHEGHTYHLSAVNDQAGQKKVMVLYGTEVSR